MPKYIMPGTWASDRGGGREGEGRYRDRVHIVET